MAAICKGEDIAGDRLAALSSAAGPRMEIVVRALAATVYEVEGKKQKFHVFALQIMDASGHASFMTENIYGRDAERTRLLKERQDYWLPDGKPSVWRLQPDYHGKVRHATSFCESFSIDAWAAGGQDLSRLLPASH